MPNGVDPAALAARAGAVAAARRRWAGGRAARRVRRAAGPREGRAGPARARAPAAAAAPRAAGGGRRHRPVAAASCGPGPALRLGRAVTFAGFVAGRRAGRAGRARRTARSSRAGTSRSGWWRWRPPRPDAARGGRRRRAGRDRRRRASPGCGSRPAIPAALAAAVTGCSADQVLAGRLVRNARAGGGGRTRLGRRGRADGRDLHAGSDPGAGPASRPRLAAPRLVVRDGNLLTGG